MRLPLASSSPALGKRAWPAWLDFSGDDGEGHTPDDKLQNWSSLIGIITAICGNVLIALALNVQRYAHIRLQRKKLQIRERARQAMKNAVGTPQDQAGGGRYGAAWTSNGDSSRTADGTPNGSAGGQYHDDDARESAETEPLARSFRPDDSVDVEFKAKAASASYLRDPYWWLGQVLITVGEMGNFLAYGFAPASIVSPLGVVALVSNCVIAPIFFKEVFRQRDFWGVLIAVTGAVTVVLSAKTEETKLGPHEVWDAITTMEFEIYMGVSCSLILLLMWLSPRYGNRTILIDLGLVGLFGMLVRSWFIEGRSSPANLEAGGYTALATKGVSSMLSSTLLGAFTTPVTYVLAFVLLFTAIMQVRYVNKALQRFDSTQVIPIQFVLFTLSVIIGSAVLYRDFERTTLEQATKFVGGCLFTFFGVFLITSGRPRQDDEDEVTLSDAEGIEETIGLAEQDPTVPPPAPPQRRRVTTSERSRGSSRASRVSSRVQPSVPAQKPLLINSDNDDADSPLLGNPWRDRDEAAGPDRPWLGPHTISSDSIVSVVPSSGESDSEVHHQHTETSATNARQQETIPTIIGTTPPRISTNRPVTPRAPASSSRLHVPQPPPASHLYSPSPFSSTLSAVVGDKLLGHIDGSGGSGALGYSSSPTPGSHSGVAATRRISRPGLRNSLFVSLSQDDGSAEERYCGRARGSLSAGEPSATSSILDGEEDANGNGNGSRINLRGRARSLSQTLGLAGLFGGGNGAGKIKRRATVTSRRDINQREDNEVAEDGLLGRGLERTRMAGGLQRSTETL
jgi:hypothetical protein